MNPPPGPLAPATRLAHAARAAVSSVTQPVAPPLYQSVVYRFDSLDQLDAVHEGTTAGFFYYRYGTPNHRQLEQVVADLEGAEDAVAAASGMAAFSASLLALLSAGDHVLVDRQVYGGTYSVLTSELPRFGVEVEFVDLAAPEALARAARPATRLLLLETLTNPPCASPISPASAPKRTPATGSSVWTAPSPRPV